LDALSVGVVAGGHRRIEPHDDLRITGNSASVTLMLDQSR
jgi:hypothetical protein